MPPLAAALSVLDVSKVVLGPEATATVTVETLVVSGLPYLSWMATVMAGLIAAPAVTLLGCLVMTSLLAAAALTVKLEEVAAVSAPSLNFSVKLPALSRITLLR